MNNLIVGIDPGMSGAIAVIERDTARVGFQQTFTRMTEADIAGLVSGIISDKRIVAVYFEKVAAMPKQGVHSVFVFGVIYGLLRGLVLGRQRLVNVTPQTWQKHLGCLSKGDKRITKLRAQELFPGIKITHGNADALLIAEFGRRIEKGEASEHKKVVVSKAEDRKLVVV